MFLTQKDKMYLYNYYIVNGSFAGYYKVNNILYKKILAIKENDETEEALELSASEYVEYLMFPNRFTKENLSSEVVILLTKHFQSFPSLTGSKLDKSLDGRLRRLAKKLDLDYKEFLLKLDTVELYPTVMHRVKNQYDIRAYNNLIQAIVFGILLETKENKNIKKELLVDFENARHMKEFEPGSYAYLESKVPKYAGPLVDSESIANSLTGVEYRGIDCKLDTSSSIINDIIYVLKGYVPLKNLKPYTYFKLEKMLRVSGNLNRIGLDEMNLFEELEEISVNLGYASVGEYLKAEGYNLTPISEKEVDIIKCGNNHEVIMHNYSDGQIILDSTMLDMIEKSNLTQNLNILVGPVLGQKDVPILVYNYDNENKLVCRLFNKDGRFIFKDGNTLNNTIENMRG